MMSIGRVYKEGARALIPLLVGLYYALGVLFMIPANSHLWEIPVVSRVGSFFVKHSLDQKWLMFSPPPRMRRSLAFVVEFDDGWSELTSLDGFVQDQVRGTLVQPRGAFRLLNFLRAAPADSIPGGLTETSLRAFYFQQISEFFCRGDGAIPGARTIRFYLVGETPPNFLDLDRWGEPLEEPSDWDFRTPLYEQACTGR